MQLRDKIKRFFSQPIMIFWYKLIWMSACFSAGGYAVYLKIMTFDDFS